MRNLAVIAFASCFAGAQAVSLFSDGFETGDFSLWTAAAATGVSSVQTTTVHSGTFAAQMSGTTGSRRFANASRAELPGETIEYSFWMKLNAASGNHRHFSEIRSYAGDVYNVGALEQLYAIGTWNAATVNTYSSAKWQARLTFNRAGGPAVAGWYTLTDAPNRTTDWTKFTVKLSPTTIEFYVNDVLGLAAMDRGNTGSIDSVILGSNLSSASIDAFYDDVSLTAVPEPASLAALGVGAAALLRRRRRA